MSKTISGGKYKSTRKTTHRARLERIIFGPCRDILCDLLIKEIDPSNLPLRVNNFIRNLKRQKCPFTKEQEILIQGGNYRDFDITLLYTLLRNICSFVPHTNHWGNKPSPGDKSVSANIERIRIVRNEHGHNSEISLSDVDFNTKWQHIFDTVSELEKYLGGCVYKDEIMRIKLCSMDPEQETMFTKQLEVISEKMNNCVPLNVQAMYETDISRWRDDDKVFIEMHNFPAMLEQVRKRSFITFVGVPGSGKSATARHIALILQSEGYQIIPIKLIPELENYCDPENRQIFVIDDVLGFLGMNKQAFQMLNLYKERLEKPSMSETKIIMTCREDVFRNEALSGCFLNRKKNVILLNSGEYALNNQDVKNLLAVYNLDEKLLLSSHLQLSLYRKMFPLLFKLFSQERFRAYGPEFFSSPIPCMLGLLDNIQHENKIHYASLVLLMINQNKLSKDILDNETSDFKDMKCKVFRACRVKQSTDSFKLIDALSEMIGTYTKECGSEFSFMHASMFEITAYQFGHQFQELLLQHMSGHYIANYIKVDSSETEKGICDQDIRHRSHERMHNKDAKQEDKIDLCILLKKSLYQKFAERLSRDVMKREFFDVFGHEALKHPTILQAFIELMKRMSYNQLFSVFLLGLKEQFKIQRNEQANFGVKSGDYFYIQKLLLGEKSTQSHYKDSVRAISWIIYHGHHQILQCIVDRMIKEKNTVDDLFQNFDAKVSSLKTNSVKGGSGKCIKMKDVYTIGPSSKIMKTWEKQEIEEQFRLLCLSCYSGDLKTFRIILSHVKKDVVIDSSRHSVIVSGEKENIIWKFEPLVIACKQGYLEIVMELLNSKADVNLHDEFHTPLSAACENGHLDVVKFLIKEGAKVNHCFQSQTPLTIACANGEIALAELLIKEGADVNVHRNQTLLAGECHTGHLNTVKANEPVTQFTGACCLKGLGEDEDSAKERKNLNTKNRNITTVKFEDLSYQKRLKTTDFNIYKKDNNRTPLTAACFKGFYDIVQILITAGADINLQDASHTPLTAACENGHLKEVDILIKEGADVNLGDESQTPLTAACHRGNLNIVQRLIQTNLQVGKGNLLEICSLPDESVLEKCPKTKTEANLNIEYEGDTRLIQATLDLNKRDKNRTPLTSACFKGFFDIVQILIAEGADINLQDASHTPLTAACESGHLKVVDILIKEGADVNLGDKSQTPLTAACHRGNLNIVQRLIQTNLQVGKGKLEEICSLPDESVLEECPKTKTEADLNIEYEGETRLIQATLDLNKRDKNRTPLTAACFKGFFDIVQILIAEGADINLQDASHTPLTAACESGHLKVADILIKEGADVNLGNESQTLLRAACHRGNLSTVLSLIKKKLQGHKGNSLETCSLQDESVVTVFSKREVDLNIEYKGEHKMVKLAFDFNETYIKKKTPLTVACCNGHSKIVQMLIAAGADVNLHDISYVPLTAACKYGHLSVVKLLINANADVNKNYRWNTPLRTASSEGHLSIVEELIRANANINQIDVGKTPLGTAQKKGHSNIEEKLIKEGAIIN